jgi:hypothetical protein
MEQEKKTYSSPTLTVYGDVEVITQGSDFGSFLDQSFPTGTPRRNLTFS